MWRGVRAMCGLLIAAAALTACGGPAGGDGKSTTPGVTETPDLECGGPLAPYLGSELKARDKSELRLARQVEEQIAICMSEAGFTYVPRDPELPKAR